MQGKVIDIEVTLESNGAEDFKNDEKYLKKMCKQFVHLSLRGKMAIVGTLSKMLLEELKENANS